jgi:hypothetical protein
MIEYPSGIDYLWVASDARDNLAALITCGSGGVPKLLLHELADLIDYESALLALPITSDVCTFEKFDSGDWDYIYLSNRGIFVFHWTDTCEMIKTRKYHKITAPTHPLLMMDALPALDGLKIIKLNKIVFQETHSFDIARHLDCEFDIH